jgi:hypothetical protein
MTVGLRYQSEFYQLIEYYLIHKMHTYKLTFNLNIAYEIELFHIGYIRMDAVSMSVFMTIGLTCINYETCIYVETAFLLTD